MDGSGTITIGHDECIIEQAFAPDAVAAFAATILFDNGGQASYVQYSTSFFSCGNFDSAQFFNEFADADT